MPTVRPDDFFSESPPPRIIGTECEYEIQDSNLQHLGFDDFKRYVNSSSLGKVGLISSGQFLVNGGRIYLDVGNLEYSSPECLGPRQAAVADIAGTYVMGDIISASGTQHNGLYRNAGTFLHQETKQKPGSPDYRNGGTKGYHENYMFPRSISADSLFDTLIPSHLATRLWAMMGTVREHYVFSQKVWGVGGEPIERTITRRAGNGNKPMIIIPPQAADEDVLGNSDWVRLEVRFAEPGLSPTIRYLALAATSLMVRMIEYKDILGEKSLHELGLKHPVEAAQMFASDLSMGSKAETVEGKKYTAMNIQEILADKALELGRYIELPEDEAEAARIWYCLIEKMQTISPENVDYGDLTLLLDVAAKHYYLSRMLSSEELSRDNPHAVKRAFIWDRIVPEGVGQKWWAKIGSEYISEQEIQDAKYSAPATRARIRGSAIEQQNKQIIAIGWSGIQFENDTYLGLSDPYETLEE